MKLYTTSDQTAKLIELGFEKPKSISSIKVTGNIITTADDLIGEPPSVMGGKITANYSIGELLSFLPKEIDCNGFKDTLYIFVNQGVWVVEYSDFLGELYSTYRTELIDAIFDVCVKLKEEGVI